MVSQAWSRRQGKIPLATQHPWNLATQSPGEWCLWGPLIRVVPQGRAHHGTAPLSRTPDGHKTESLSLSHAHPQSFTSRDRCIHAIIRILHACMVPSGVLCSQPMWTHQSCTSVSRLPHAECLLVPAAAVAKFWRSAAFYATGRGRHGFVPRSALQTTFLILTQWL